MVRWEFLQMEYLPRNTFLFLHIVTSSCLCFVVYACPDVRSIGTTGISRSMRKFSSLSKHSLFVNFGVVILQA